MSLIHSVIVRLNVLTSQNLSQVLALIVKVVNTLLMMLYMLIIAAFLAAFMMIAMINIMDHYLNHLGTTELPVQSYQLNLQRSKAVQVLVVHFDLKFFYFLRKYGKKKVTIFFALADYSRSWFFRIPLTSPALSEHLINVYVNRIADYLNYEINIRTVGEVSQDIAGTASQAVGISV